MNSYSKAKKNQINVKNIFDNLKSKYILQILFDNLNKKKLLYIIKYNKNIQNKININVNDYKTYLEKYSPIELEIIPKKNEYGKYININKGDEKYYHIYVNNNKEEIKRYILRKDDNITKIKIIIDYQVKSFENLFSFCKCIEFLSFIKFYRNNITNMNRMFFGCQSLKEINLNKFNTNNVTHMRSMFHGCSSLKELNLSNFNTNNVIDMSSMLCGLSFELQNKIEDKYKDIKKEVFTIYSINNK